MKHVRNVGVSSLFIVIFFICYKHIALNQRHKCDQQFYVVCIFFLNVHVVFLWGAKFSG